MKETATVKTINDQTVVLGCNESKECVGCSASGGCGALERVYEAENPRHLTLSPGDEVLVELPHQTAVGAALLVFLLPLLLFFLFYLLSTTIIPEASSPFRALAGLLGLAAGFGIALLVGRSRRMHRLPQICGYPATTRLR